MSSRSTGFSPDSTAIANYWLTYKAKAPDEEVIGTSPVSEWLSVRKETKISWAGALVRCALSNNATGNVFGSYSNLGDDPASGTSIAVADEVRNISLCMVRGLRRLSESDLEYGNRYQAVTEIVGSFPKEHPSDYCDALNRVLMVDSKFVSNEAKSAIIRHSIFLDDVPLSGLTRALVTALESSSSEQVVAAATTLGDIADTGAIPAIRSRLKNQPEGRARHEMEKAIRRIKAADELAARP